MPCHTLTFCPTMRSALLLNLLLLRLLHLLHDMRLTKQPPATQQSPLCMTPPHHHHHTYTDATTLKPLPHLLPHHEVCAAAARAQGLQ